MTQIATVPALEERDFQAISAALQIIEAIVLTRGHLPRTDRQMEELRKSIEWERRVLEEKAAKERVQHGTSHWRLANKAYIISGVP
jgi:hypothetical protein